MNEYKLLSILIVTFKQIEYLYSTVDSVLSQDYPYIEVIISDDNTPDFPTNEVEQYIENNKKSNLVRYSVIHNMTNSGTVRNINIGLKRCSGECIKIIAGDDLFFDQTVWYV